MEALAEDIEIELKPEAKKKDTDVSEFVNKASATKKQVDIDESTDTADLSVISTGSKEIEKPQKNDPVADLTRELKEKFNID
jgi:hypothetical protein